MSVMNGVVVKESVAGVREEAFFGGVRVPDTDTASIIDL